jgi:hypothetical protein
MFRPSPMEPSNTKQSSPNYYPHVPYKKMFEPSPMEPSNTRRNIDEDLFLNVFEHFLIFNNNYNRIDKIKVLIKFNNEIKDDINMTSYYYNYYKKVYENFKNSIKEVQQTDEGEKKEKYKEIFFQYLNNCNEISKKLNNKNDIEFKNKINNHILFISHIYYDYLNKEPSVQGGKKSSEYIDYKFQNKIYRRKIRYEGKKKYIILNKQKVFIKNKK